MEWKNLLPSEINAKIFFGKLVNLRANYNK